MIVTPTRTIHWLFILVFFPFLVIAQKEEQKWSCGSDILLQKSLKNAAFNSKHHLLEQHCYDSFFEKNKNNAAKSLQLLTLPVVVHIVHDNGAENITDARVLDGIQQLNEAFANTVYYDQGSGVNTMIQFCLARRTPDNLPTTGITRDQNALTEIVMETDDIALKDLNRWTPTDYINIWLIREICSNSIGCGVAGYAYFPFSHGMPEDGIVMEAQYMGSSPGNTGVLAHEMGHYLGLYHTFQGACENDDCLADGDRVCDTPPDQSTLWVACNAIVNTCNTDFQSGFTSDQPDMILNFMDYTDFDCFHDFTQGQSDRMQWHVNNVRSSLLDSKGCVDPCSNPVTALFTASAIAINVGQTVTFTNGSTNASSYQWTINGVPFSSLQNSSYTFNTTGYFTIRLVANSADPANCFSQYFEQVVTVTCPVTADFEVTTATPLLGETVGITQQSINANQFEWFLDGVSQGVSFTSFTPTSTGVYVIRLVANNGFCEDAKVIYLSVQEACENLTFQNFFGDDRNNEATHLITLSDGNILTGGTTDVGGDVDMYLLKTNVNGAVVWQKRVLSSGTDQVRRLLPLSDGGWMLAAMTTNGSGNRPFLARFDSDGNIVWQKAINFTSTVNLFSDVILLQDGNLLISGVFRSNATQGFAIYLAKMGLDGTLIWSRAYDDSSTDWIEKLVELPNGDLIGAGFTLSFGQNTSAIHDGLIMRFSADGTQLWANAYGSADNEGLFGIHLHPNGSLIAYGATSGWNGPSDIYLDDLWLISIDENGIQQWSKVIQNTQGIDMSGRSAVLSADGGLVFAGNDYGNIGANVPIYLKTDQSGDIEWSRVYSGSGGRRITATGLMPSGYLLAGFTTDNGNKDLWLLKTDLAGFAGVCQEELAVFSELDIQPITASGLLGTIPPPAMINAGATMTDYALQDSSPCAPDCQDNASCENTWIKQLGASGASSIEGGNNILHASDGNFYVNGYRNDSTLIIKFTPDGNVIWLRSFKFTSGVDEVASQLIEDSDGNLVGCGFYFINNTQLGFTFKYNPNSDQVIWAFENPSFPRTLYYAIAEKSPGGNYLAFNAYHNSPAPGSQDDAHWVEINRNTGQYLNPKWGFSLGASEGVAEIKIYNNKVYTIGRYTYGGNLSGMRGGISCFDLSGNELWSRMPFFTANQIARNYGKDFVIDNNQMVSIYFGDFNGQNTFTHQFAVSKSDLNGNLIWAKVYSSNNTANAIFVKTIIQTPDGYVIYAASEAIDLPAAIYMIKINKVGEVLWAKEFQGLIADDGEKFLALVNDYLYFTASSGAGDIVIGKISVVDGLVGNECDQPVDFSLTVADLPNVFNAVTLTRYPSPITQNSRNVSPHTGNLPLQNICLSSCSPEICNNGIDDDGDGLFDCLDPDCDCTSCDGEQANNWFFGDGGGLDFSNAIPSFLPGGQTFSREASSVASDMMGNLLFYTDASRLYDRSHTIMPNGDNLDGHASTTQTLILPQPGQPWRFFVFTPNSFDNLATGKGLSYSIVNMALNGGMGDVEPNQKNIELLPQSQFTEKITATRHCNGEDWWVVVKERNNNAFRAYLLSATGLSTPVISSSGTPGSAASPNVIGVLKFAPNGRKLLNTLYHTSGFDLLDFDNSTGMISNAITITNPAYAGAYGAEFSANGRLLYLSNLAAPSAIHQFDLQAGTAAAINQSSVALALFQDQYRFGQLQRAPNGKIYVTNTFPLVFTNALGIIHLPEVQGQGCLYQHEGQNLLPGGANLGLPSFPQDFLPKILTIDIAGQDSLCQIPGTLDFNLDISDVCVIDSVRWILAGIGSIETQSNEDISVSFTQAGTATLIARAFSECANASDTLVIHILDSEPPVLDLGPDVFVCDNGVQVLHAGPGFSRYRWNDGTQDSTLTTLFPGTYWVDAWDLCGNKQSDTIQVSVLPVSILDLGEDRQVCSSASELTYILPSYFTAWNWSPATGLDCANCPTVHISGVGIATTYIVVASSAENCLSADTLTIIASIDTIFTYLDTAVCINETLQINGLTLPADTMITLTYISEGGCDSLLTIRVAAYDIAETFVNESICPGDTLLVDGIPITRDTMYQRLLTTTHGCDSIVNMNIQLLESPTLQIDIPTCNGLPAIYQSTVIPPGEYRTFFVANPQGNCDSIIIVHAVPVPEPIVNLPLADTLKWGNSITLNPAVFGTGPFQWLWSPDTPSDWLSCYDCPDPVASPLSSIIFTLTVTDGNGCLGADSISLTVLPCADPYAPNAFSPNQDGINDRFYLQEVDCPVTIRYMRIFDRWGDLCFERKDFPVGVEEFGWDGRMRGKFMNTGVYVWMAELEFPNGLIVLRKGDITLLK